MIHMNAEIWKRVLIMEKNCRSEEKRREAATNEHINVEVEAIAYSERAATSIKAYKLVKEANHDQDRIGTCLWIPFYVFDIVMMCGLSSLFSSFRFGSISWYECAHFHFDCTIRSTLKKVHLRQCMRVIIGKNKIAGWIETEKKKICAHIFGSLRTESQRFNWIKKQNKWTISESQSCWMDWRGELKEHREGERERE